MNDTDELKISEMEETEQVNNEDWMMIVQDGINKKTKVENVGINDKIKVVDNLNSTSEIDALSAKQGKILNEKVSKTILWENTTNLINFDAQEIALKNSDYDYLIIYTYRNYKGDNRTIPFVIEKDKKGEITYFDIFESEGIRGWWRTIEIINNKVKFGEGRINSNSNNNVLVPYKIMGCRY